MRIGIEDLAVAYDARRVIDGLSVAIEPGSVFTLLGPSGCGKTTLLRAIAGFVPVAAGRILFGERDVARLPAHRRNIGMVFQDYALFPDKTVFDNVAYGLRARNVAEAEVRARVGEALERVGLGALAYLIISARMRPGREEVYPPEKYLERERLEEVREQKAAPKEAAKVTEVAPPAEGAPPADGAPAAEEPPETRAT